MYVSMFIYLSISLFILWYPEKEFLALTKSELVTVTFTLIDGRLSNLSRLCEQALW